MLQAYFTENLLPYVKALPDSTAVRDSEDRIFSIWLQGEEQAPDIVQASFRSIRRNCRQELLVLDSRTLANYIDLPGEIMDKYRKGRIKAAHFADICRVELLYNHGGIWMDSTDYAFSPVPDYILDEDFFVFLTGRGHSCDYSFMQNCFIRARKGDFLLAAWREMQNRYWMALDRHLDYFQHQIMFKALVYGEERAAAEFAKMPHILQDPTHIISYCPVDRRYDPAEFRDIAEASFFQKLSYRNCAKAPAGSIYDYLRRQ